MTEINESCFLRSNCLVEDRSTQVFCDPRATVVGVSDSFWIPMGVKKNYVVAISARLILRELTYKRFYFAFAKSQIDD